MTQTPTPKTVKCPHCDREIAYAQLGNHVRAMHSDVKAPPSPPLRSVPEPDDDGMQWEEPPVTAMGRKSVVEKLRPLVVKLKRHPGRWARVWDYDGPTSAATQVKKAREAFPDCEFRAAKTENGSAIWARAVEDDA